MQPVGYAIEHKFFGFLCVSGGWSTGACGLRFFDKRKEAKKVSDTFLLTKVVVITSIGVGDL